MKRVGYVVIFFLTIPYTQVLGQGNNIASEVIGAFKAKNYEGVYRYFFIPPYYSSEDREIDRKSAVKVLEILNQELGGLEQYTETDSVGIDPLCLGAVCGIGDAGFYHGDFSTGKNPDLYLKTYKADFSTVKGIYIYLFLLQQRGTLSVVQFGVAFPRAADETVELKLTQKVEQVFCHDVPHKKKKVLADRLLDRSATVEYRLLTKEGTLINVAYGYGGSFDPGSPIRNTKVSLPQEERLSQGEKVYHLVTQQGSEVGVRFSFFEDPPHDTIQLEPPHRDTEVQDVFSVESQEGFIINFSFSWKDGALSAAHDEPSIHPFSGMSSVECYAEPS